ncbi:MAG: hypothetical protein GY927_03925 [bacterium]|nr:hypothetical protein [bacterium]
MANYTEIDIIRGLHDEACQVAGLDHSTVFVNDWSYADNPQGNESWLLFIVAEDWNSNQETAAEIRTYNIGSLLITRFAHEVSQSWAESLSSFVNLRDRMLDVFGDVKTNARSAGGLSQVHVNDISNAGERIYLDENGDQMLNDDEGIPVFIGQPILWEIKYEVC